MNNENMPVITDREELYDKCENMEQLFDKYYLPLLDKHYSKVYQLQQENKILKENTEHNDKVVDKVNWENMLLKKENEQLKKQVDEYKKLGFKYLQDKNNNLEIQQKEFINYLEDEIKRLKENDIYQPLQKMALATHEHTLQKYKSIIGVSDEKK